MPFYRSKRRPFRGKARPFRRSGRKMDSWASAGAKAGSLAKIAWRGVQKLRGLVNSEMYKLDQTLTAQNIDQGTPIVQHITAVAQGDGDGQRTGNSILARSFNFKGLVYRSSAGDANQMVRVSVIQDTQQVGDTTPLCNNIYEGTNPYNHLNSDSVGRYKVLYTKSFILDTVKNLSQILDINVPMMHHVRYNGTASTDIQKGGLYFVFTSTQGTSNFPAVTGEMRLSYHDN